MRMQNQNLVVKIGSENLKKDNERGKGSVQRILIHPGPRTGARPKPPYRPKPAIIPNVSASNTLNIKT
jgi:hypothetical protein